MIAPRLRDLIGAHGRNQNRDYCDDDFYQVSFPPGTVALHSVGIAHIWTQAKLYRISS